MNDYEKLYKLLKNIEFHISKHELFTLSYDKAIQTILRKLYVIKKTRMMSKIEEEIILCKEMDLNHHHLDTLDYYQESLKWIFRWCKKYCSGSSENKIYAKSVIELMHLAYLYEKYYNLWFLHSKGLLNVNIRNKSIKFTPVKESFKYSCIYDSFIIDFLNKTFIKNDNLTPYMQLISVHEESLNLLNNYELQDFTVNDYKKISIFLNEYLVQHYYKTKVYVIKENDAYLCKTKSEWINLIHKEINISKKKIESIINYFTYDKDNDLDINLLLFIPIDGRLAISEDVFMMSDPSNNFLRLLANRKEKEFDKYQNTFEYMDKNYIKERISDRYLVSSGKTKAESIRPGMDVLIYDPKSSILHVIEMKHKIPIDSVTELCKLDKMLKKAQKQISIAHKYCELHQEKILSEYFGKKLNNVKPKIIVNLILTNYTIGSGFYLNFPSKVLNLDHYIYIMNKHGIEKINSILVSKNKGVNSTIQTIEEEFTLFDHVIYSELYLIKYKLIDEV